MLVSFPGYVQVSFSALESRGIGFLGAEVADSCELPVMGAGN